MQYHGFEGERGKLEESCYVVTLADRVSLLVHEFMRVRFVSLRDVTDDTRLYFFLRSKNRVLRSNSFLFLRILSIRSLLEYSRLPAVRQYVQKIC